jgi:signal peptidase I
MNTAIFEFYESGKFRMGNFVLDWGNPIRGGYLDDVFSLLSQRAYGTTPMLLAIKQQSLFLQISKNPFDKNPFPNQFKKNGEAIYPMDVFWFRKLNENKLLRNNIFSNIKYQFHFNKKNFKFIIDYNNHTMEFTQSNSKQVDYQFIFSQAIDWAFKLDKELADCDCLN